MFTKMITKSLHVLVYIKTNSTPSISSLQIWNRRQIWPYMNCIYIIKKYWAIYFAINKKLRLTLFLSCSYFFGISEARCFYKIVLIKKSVFQVKKWRHGSKFGWGKFSKNFYTKNLEKLFQWVSIWVTWTEKSLKGSKCQNKFWCFPYISYT